MNYKTCSKCGKPLPATSEFFGPEKRNKNGLQASCRGCQREYRENNREKVKQRVRKYYENNLEKENQRSREYRENNLEKCRQQSCDWKKANPEKCRQQSCDWRKANPEKAAAYNVKRRALKLNQSPILTDSEDKRIKLIYKKSHELGSDWQVDHRIPISKGGQHHPDNLQIVTATYNLEKSDKLDFRLPTETEYFKL